MKVSRAEIVSILRSRGQNARADWVDRELPEHVDTGKNHSLLSTLHIDQAALHQIVNAPQHA